MFTMLRFAGILLVLTSLLSPALPDRQPVQDQAYIRLKNLYDAEGLPRGYEAYIKTPICETENCYTVEINFTWDLIGRFLKFDTLPGKGLTKLDHIPFTEVDYQQLDRLLKTSDSPLANYRKEDLIRDTRSSAIDGFTGATALEIKESVISGGVYSCYTLWHIAHGGLVDSIQARTYQQLDTALVEKMVGIQDQEMNYFLIRHFSGKDYHKYLSPLLSTFENARGYYAKRAIERMPATVFSTPFAQDFFARYFDQLNYFAQVALLKKLSSDGLSTAMVQCLERQVDSRNSYKDQLVRALLSPDKDP